MEVVGAIRAMLFDDPADDLRAHLGKGVLADFNSIHPYEIFGEIPLGQLR